MTAFKSYILRNDPYRGGAVREGKTAFKMSSNENPLGPSPKALQAIQQHFGEMSEYQFESDLPLTSKLAAVFGNRLQAAQFFPANGGMELLDLICRAFLEPGDSCILSSPAFMAYHHFVSLCGANIVDIPLKRESFSLDVDGMLASVDERTRLIFVTNPNNPTGTMTGRADMDRLIGNLPDRVVVVYDEVYHHYADEADYPRALDYIIGGRPVIGIHSFSKAYGLAGLRLGYLFSTMPIADYIRHLRRPFMVNNLSMVAAIAALDDEKHLSATLTNNCREKHRLYQAFDKLEIKYWRSQTNFILFRPGMDPKAFVDQMLASGIMVRNADVMAAPGCVRVSIGTAAMNQAFIAATEHVLSACVSCS
jgi:histidinol-phosphate aminotransferase